MICISAILTLSASTGQDAFETYPLLTDAAKGPMHAARIIRVGPGRRYQTPSEAAAEVAQGDIIEIDAGLYTGDVAVWPQNDITLRGVGGIARLAAAGRAAEGKAIWVIKGNNVTVENLEFSGARVADRNGAGIRFEGSGLTLRNCFFHHNEMGLLTGGRSDGRIRIEASEFANNTTDYRRHGRLGHNIYIGKIARFTLVNSYVHDASTGHNVKSRARENFILYNRIGDENAASSYLLDLPNGGRAVVLGNLFHQHADSENQTLIAFAAEHNRQSAEHSLYVVNNTAVNGAAQGRFVTNHSIAPANLVNNLWAGTGRLLSGPGELVNNLLTTDHIFRDATHHDYRLRPDAPAIDSGIDPGSAAGFPLVPRYQYLHPRKLRPRPALGQPDIGAYEYDGR